MHGGFQAELFQNHCFRTTGYAATLRSIFFIQPLALEVPGLQVECAITNASFEVRSGALVPNGSVLENAVVHSSGTLVLGARDTSRVEPLSARRNGCARALVDRQVFARLCRPGCAGD